MPSPSRGSHAGRRDPLAHERGRRFGGKGLGDALGRSADLAPRRGGERHGREDLEHGHRHQHDDCEPWTAECAGRDAGSGDGDRGEGGDAGEQRDQRSGAGLCARASHHRPAQRGVGRRDARTALLFGAERHQHVQTAEMIEHRVGEQCPQRRDRSLGAGTGRPAPQCGDERCKGEAGEQRECCRPPDERDEDHGSDRHERRRHQRLDHTQREVLQIVDVVDERAEHRAAACARQAVGCQRHQAPHEVGARRGELAQCGVVPSEALEVAEDGARDGEEPHADDGGRQVQHRRLLARADDQPRADDEQGDSGCLRGEAGAQCPPEPAGGRQRATQDGARSGGRGGVARCGRAVFSHARLFSEGTDHAGTSTGSRRTT